MASYPRNGDGASQPGTPFSPDVLPFSPGAERALLGSMLRDNAVIADVAGLLAPSDFHVDANQKLYAVLLDLFADGKAADLVTVASAIEARQQSQDVTPGYLGTLYSEAPVWANATHYAALVRDQSVKRSLFRAGQCIAAQAKEPGASSTEILADAEQRIFAIAQGGLQGETTPLSVATGEAFDQYDERTRPGQEGNSLRTGWECLDDIMAGLHPSEAIVVAARPSVGKTAMGLAFVQRLTVHQQVPTFFASLEQGRVELANRLLCMEGDIDSHRLRQGKLTPVERDRMADTRDVLNKCPLHIADNPFQNMLSIAANARRLQMRHGIRLVIIDYMQLVSPDDSRQPRQEQVAGISRRVKQLARELKAPVVALAQVNRASEDRQDRRPRLSDLRESGAIENDADTVLLLHRPTNQPYPDEELIEVEVAKQRNGPTGSAAMVFRKAFMRFEPHSGATRAMGPGFRR